MSPEEMQEIHSLIGEELNDLENVLVAQGNAIDSLVAEKQEDRHVMRSMQMRIEVMQRRIKSLEQHNGE